MSRGAKLWTGSVLYIRGFTRRAVENCTKENTSKRNILKHDHYEMFGSELQRY